MLKDNALKHLAHCLVCRTVSVTGNHLRFRTVEILKCLYPTLSARGKAPQQQWERWEPSLPAGWCDTFVSRRSAPHGSPLGCLSSLPFHLPEEAITTNEVINQLLHHVGAMCIHQLNLLATNPNLPITSVLGKQHPIEAHHVSSICDIMEKAMVNGDTCIIRCVLVVFQVNTLVGK